jgi:hypothetical protein
MNCAADVGCEPAAECGGAALVRVAPTPSEAIEFLNQGDDPGANPERTNRISRLILLDNEAPQSRGVDVVHFIMRGLRNDPDPGRR